MKDEGWVRHDPDLHLYPRGHANLTVLTPTKPHRGKADRPTVLDFSMPGNKGRGSGPILLGAGFKG